MAWDVDREPTAVLAISVAAIAASGLLEPVMALRDPVSLAVFWTFTAAVWIAIRVGRRTRGLLDRVRSGDRSTR